MATVTDDFNRPDSNSLGANWTEHEAAADALRIFTNRLRSKAAPSTPGYAYYNQALTADQYAQVVFVNDIQNGGGGGPAVRIDTAGDQSSATGYFVWVDSGATPDIRLYKFQAAALDLGSATLLGTGAITWSGGEVVRLEAIGTTVRVLVDDVEKVSVTDSDIASGRAGIGHPSFPGFTFQTDWDSFEAGDLGAAAASQNNRRPWVKRRNLIWSRHY